MTNLFLSHVGYKYKFCENFKTKKLQPFALSCTCKIYYVKDLKGVLTITVKENKNELPFVRKGLTNFRTLISVFSELLLKTL